MKIQLLSNDIQLTYSAAKFSVRFRHKVRAQRASLLKISIHPFQLQRIYILIKIKNRLNIDRLIVKEKKSGMEK